MFRFNRGRLNQQRDGKGNYPDYKLAFKFLNLSFFIYKFLNLDLDSIG